MRPELLSAIKLVSGAASQTNKPNSAEPARVSEPKKSDHQQRFSENSKLQNKE
jgi:hypothetical protein